MRQLLTIAGMLLLLSACDHVEEDGKAARELAEKDVAQVGENVEARTVAMADRVRDGLKRTGSQLRDWWITPLPGKGGRPIKSSYCYSSLQDILCYRQPMPGWEHRLVAYQGTNALPPKPPAQMQPLPESLYDARALPENRVAAAKPVFKEPPKVDEEKAKEGEEDITVIDPTREQLPNPTAAPQL